MKKVILIADSGGSKTDWCLLINHELEDNFTTCSYHPQNVTYQWIEDQKKFWNEFVQRYDITLYFFGAGCLTLENKELMRQVFKEFGFEKVHLEADIMGAAKACFGDNDGFIAIMGTGSVLAEIKKHKLAEIRGGFGHLLGDEGGGYFFGKLLLQNYLQGKLSAEILHAIEIKFGDKSALFQKVYGSNGKMFISGLSKFCSNFDASCIIELHRENIRIFLNQYLPIHSTEKTLHVVGSYAFYNQEILKEELHVKGWEMGKICSRPIDELAKYFVKNGF